MDYKPNSNRFRKEQQNRKGLSDEPKKVEKVIKGKVKTRKKSEIKKFADTFITEDMANVKSYILTDIVVPSVKKAISDVVDTILFGGSGRKSSTGSRVSYGSYYNKDSRRPIERNRMGYSYDDIIFDSRGEAEKVLMGMDELIDTYKMVSVADFYDLVGISGSYTDNKYGWTDIRDASVLRIRDGYIIKLPRALPLD